jgi:hypothetical protein
MAYKFSLGSYRHSGTLVTEDALTVDSGGLSITGASTFQALTASTISASSTLQVAGVTTLGGNLNVNGGVTHVQTLTASAGISGTLDLIIGGQTTLGQTLTITGGGAVVTGTLNTNSTITANGAITATTGDIKASSGQLSSSNGVQTAAGITAGGTIVGGTVTGSNGLYATGGGVVAQSGDIKALSGQVSASTGFRTAGDIQSGQGITAATGDIKALSGNITASLGLFVGQAGGTPVVLGADGRVSASAGGIFGGNLTTAGNVAVAQQLRVTGSAFFNNTVTGSSTLTFASVVSDNVDINGGTIDGATIATSNITVGSSKTLNVSAGTLTLAAGQVGADKVGAGTFNAGTFSFNGSTISDLGAVTTADINGGSLDNVAIGATVQSSVKATTLSASSTLIVDGITTLNSALTVSAGGITVSSGDSSVQKLTVNGDLIVLGNTFSASVGTMLVEDSAIVIGDGSTSFASDYGVLFGSGSNQWASLVTAQANIDGVAGNENVLSSSLPIKASAFAGTFYGNLALSVTSIGDADATLVAGVNYGNTTLSTARTWTLPTSPSIGESYKVKAPSNCSSTNTITIARAGSQTIDGETQLVLESPFAAVELIYVASNLWRVF